MRKIIVLVFSLFSMPFFAQDNIDSLLVFGNYQQAIKVLSSSEVSQENKLKIGTIYQNIGDYNNAIKYYESALKMNETVAVKVKLGSVYNLAGFPKKAINIYEDLFQRDSANLLVANSLGKLYLANSKVRKAEEIFEYLKKKDTKNPNFPYQLAIAQGRQKKLFKMGNNYLEAFNRDSLHINSIYRLAKFFKNLKFRDSTMLFIDKGLKIDRNNINFNQMKANELYALKDYDGALKHLELLDSLNYKSVNVLEMFGMAYLKLEDEEKAQSYFEKALKIEPQNSTILYRLASLQYQKKEYDKAIFSNSMAIMYAKPDLYRQYFLMGSIFKEQNNFKRAIHFYDKAYENNRSFYTALYELAVTSDAYYKDKKIAYKHYESYIDKYEAKDAKKTAFVKNRMQEIKKDYFLEGEIVD